jgi:hypothetical protein
MAHHIQVSVDGSMYCTLCGLREGFQDGCQFSIEKDKIEVENKKIGIEKEKIDSENKRIDIEKKKVAVAAVLSSLGYLIFFLFVAVVYFGLDGLKMQISRVVDECKKGGWFAAISHLFRRR